MMDPSTENDRRQTPPQGMLRDGSLIIASVIIILSGLHAARGILGPIFMATFFTVLLIQPINWLRSKGVSSWLARTCVIVGVVIVGLSAFTIIGSQLAQFAKNIPSYRDSFNEMLSANNVGISVDDVFPFLRSDKDEKEEQGKENKQEPESNDDLVRNDGAKRLVLASATLVEAPTYRTVSENADAAIDDAQTSLNAVLPADSAASNEPLWSGGTSSDGLTPKAPPALFDANARPEDLENDLTSNAGDPSLQTSEDEDEDDDEANDGPRRPTLLETGTAVRASSQELFRFLGGLARELSYLGSSAFLITLMVVFMLCESAVVPLKLVAVWGKKKFTNSHIESVVADIRNYMVIKTFMSLLVGVLVTALLIVSKVQYPLLWGFVAFLLNYIPNIGSVVAAIPPVVLATIEQGPVVGAIDAFFFVVINCGVGYGLEPRLLGDGLNLSPLVVLLALIFFGWLFGPIGMFLSPPLAVISKIIFQAFPETQWLAAMMANKPPQQTVDAENAAEA